MAEFESIEPTSLLQRIRTEGVDPRDPDVRMARNFAYFLKPHVEALIEGYEREYFGRYSGTPEKLTEIVMTGLQMLIEGHTQQATEVSGLVQ